MRFLVQLEIAMAVAVVACSVSTAQTVYTWKDANGLTHYSENAPRNGAASTLRFNETDPVLDAAPASTTSVAPAQSAGDPLEAAKLEYPKLACANARENKKVLQGHGIVVVTNDVGNVADAGNVRNLSPEERTAAAAEAQKQIDQFCDRG